MVFKPLSNTLQEILVEMFDAGEPINTIAEELRIYRGTVHKYLVREGRVVRDPEVVEQARTRYTQEERDLAVEMYHSGVAVDEIREVTGMSAPTIYAHAKKKAPVHKTPETDINKAIEMYKRKQYSVQEILDKTGVPRTTFYDNVNKRKALGEL